MTAWEYLRAKWPASAKKWAALNALMVPVYGAVKFQQVGLLKMLGLMAAAFAMLVAFTWTVSAITLYLAGAYQANGRQLPDWATKDAYGDD